MHTAQLSFELYSRYYQQNSIFSVSMCPQHIFFSPPIIPFTNTICFGTLNSSASEGWQGLLKKLFSLYTIAIASTEIIITSKLSANWDVTSRHHSCSQFICLVQTFFHHQFSMLGCALPSMTVLRFTRHHTDLAYRSSQVAKVQPPAIFNTA